MKFKTKAAMPKKGKAKPAKKGSKKPRDGSHPNALGLEGPGVEVVHIPEISEAIEGYEKIMRARVSLTAKETPAKQSVVDLMSAHADKLRNPKNGLLQYHVDDKRYVEITPAKVQIKFKEDKPKKAKKAKAGKEPEQAAQISDAQD